MQQFPQDNGNRRLEVDSETAEAGRVMQAHDHELFAKPNVQGIGFGHKMVGGRDTGESSLKVLVSHKLPQEMLGSEDMVPERIGELRTDVEAVGEFFAGLAMQTMPVTGAWQPSLGNGTHIAVPEVPRPDLGGREALRTLEQVQTEIQLLRNRVRPASSGYSVGHHAITAGTIATGVYDAAAFPGIPPRYYILSNNHVLANSNSASVGDPVLQPGRADGGTFPADVIGRLSRWVTIRFGGPDNLVDAAIAEAPFDAINREVYWIGYVQGVRNNWPAVGEILQKTGRTTNYTTGRVIAVNAAVNVSFGGGRTARFVQQIITDGMSAGGDSGSLVLDMNRNAMGLLFAGSATHTILNHIYFVQALLGIRLH